ncbi:LPS assembly protein LptD [Sulfurimonas sp.]|nr:LPS assembly protein LptD [Sulfurimonas sp.]
MFKYILLLILSVTFLYADTVPINDKVEIYATNMDTKGDIVTATGEVVVVYKDYHLNSDKAVYNRTNGDLELFDNISANQGSKIKLLGEYAKMNIAKKERMFKPFYMLERTSNVWLSGCESSAKDVEITVKSGIMSGCDPVNPLWKMEFSSAEYNSDTMWLDLYNTRIYIYDIPVFYTPYFGYSLDTTRRTGVLPPMMGYSQKEGFYYEQSLYIAESNYWDLELIPQIRTSRGNGLYSTFRFVDSRVSKGTLSLGTFKESNSYLNENNNTLANSSHYGFDFNYYHRDFINDWFGTSLEGQSGLYADIHDMNDVEYINLSSNDTIETTTTTQLLSRINMFYNNDDNYFGLYMKYYKDLTLESNKATIQNLPALHYHSYLDTLLNNHLLYSFDIQSNNYYRGEGKTAIQTDMNIPITLQTSLFDEHMNISYKANLSGQHSSFGSDDNNSANIYNNGYIGKSTHTFSVSSQLTRSFDEFTHAVDFGAEYTVDGAETRDGYYKEQEDYCAIASNRQQSICEFYNVSVAKENLKLYYSQYFYDSNGQERLYHKLTHNISYDNNISDSLENEIDYQISDNINFYSNVFYSYDEGSFSKTYNSISYSGEKFTLALAHVFADTFLPETATYSPYTSFVTSSLFYRYNKRYSYHFKMDYDLDRSEKKSAEVGFLYSKRCWDFGLRYVENNRPVLDENGVSSAIYDRYIFMTVALKPVMSAGNKSSGFVYKIPDKETGN